MDYKPEYKRYNRKTFKKNRENLWDPRVGKDFLYKRQKAITIKEKIDYLDHQNIKLCSSKTLRK